MKNSNGSNARMRIVCKQTEARHSLFPTGKIVAYESHQNENQLNDINDDENDRNPKRNQIKCTESQSNAQLKNCQRKEN